MQRWLFTADDLSARTENHGEGNHNGNRDQG
jgi:hypothetical protein